MLELFLTFRDTQAANLPLHLMQVIGPSPSQSTVCRYRPRKTRSCRHTTLSSPVMNLRPLPDLKWLTLHIG